MARPAASPTQRFATLKVAYDKLPDALMSAAKASDAYGSTDARTLAAWDNVEALSAVIHRQSRLLAGKSRGG